MTEIVTVHQHWEFGLGGDNNKRNSAVNITTNNGQINYLENFEMLKIRKKLFRADRRGDKAKKNRPI